MWGEVAGNLSARPCTFRTNLLLPYRREDCLAHRRSRDYWEPSEGLRIDHTLPSSLDDPRSLGNFHALSNGCSFEFDSYMGSVHVDGSLAEIQIIGYFL